MDVFQQLKEILYCVNLWMTVTGMRRIDFVYTRV
jgi:hypothetical protein